MAHHKITTEPNEESIHFTADLMPIGDPNARPIDLIHGGPSRQMVITFDDSGVNEQGEPDLKAIHIDATGFPADQAAFVLHEVSHMLHESNDAEATNG